MAVSTEKAPSLTPLRERSLQLLLPFLPELKLISTEFTCCDSLWPMANTFAVPTNQGTLHCPLVVQL